MDVNYGATVDVSNGVVINDGVVINGDVTGDVNDGINVDVDDGINVDVAAGAVLAAVLPDDESNDCNAG